MAVASFAYALGSLRMGWGFGIIFGLLAFALSAHLSPISAG